MDILSFLSGAAITVALIIIAFLLRKKSRKKGIIRQYQSSDLDSSVDKARTLLNAADHVKATENNAIAAIWKARKCDEHASMNENVYAIKGCWALKKKMMKVGPAGYLSDTPLPRSCGCYLTYLYNLRSLPENMLTDNARKIVNK
ncbi:hypothetical protein [Phytobacter sp. MRY16-398]|uniref:hypothetical protein n=1 Tax=Phytobacter sp. MRY16-398 TaxID=2487150 RepID=UPI000DF612A6|nr:hypothetical protein [Phytobacter sp. MRY16-398]BBE76220.1 hypothetical protein MRY16398_12760 [Phytobacter sp. MRY16-398]